MILIREVDFQDIAALERFAAIPGFINLPKDKDLIKKRIEQSKKSFLGEMAEKARRKFMFIAEDQETHQVVGTSMIAAQHGTEESPHFYLQVGTEEKYSKTIGTGFIHGTLELQYDTHGPSEIGGLVVDPEYRSTEQKIGRQISFVRFLFLGLHRDWFQKDVIAELIPPLDKKGRSALWEAIGRRFTNMDYHEADELSQKNKEFILSLFPTGKIYSTFLPPEARDAIGKVGADTEAVLHMLKKIGFRYKNQVDPFDGGPHLWVKVDELVPIQNLKLYTYTRDRLLGSKQAHDASVIGGRSGLLCVADQPRGQFRAASIKAYFADETLSIFDGDSRLPKREQVEKLLGLDSQSRVYFMPYY